MLNQYKNIDQIMSADKSVSADRISKSKTEFLDFDANEQIFFNSDILKQDSGQQIELHVYANTTWITGNHNVNIQSKIPEYRDKDTKKSINLNLI